VGAGDHLRPGCQPSKPMTGFTLCIHFIHLDSELRRNKPERVQVPEAYPSPLCPPSLNKKACNWVTHCPLAMGGVMWVIPYQINQEFWVTSQCICSTYGSYHPCKFLAPYASWFLTNILSIFIYKLTVILYFIIILK